MILKIAKAIWFFSLLACMGVMMYVYASLQETVELTGEEGVWQLSRDAFFYSTLALVSLINMLVFVVSRVYPQTHEDFKAWFYGLVVVLNIFFIIGFSFVSLTNSGERFDYARIGGIIYGSVGLIVVWSIVWPVYSLSRTFLRK